MTNVNALTFLMLAAQATGCSLLCDKGCRPGARVVEIKEETVGCYSAGQVTQEEAPFGPLNSCNSVKAEALNAVCEAAPGGFGKAEVTCLGVGRCALKWYKFVDACVCGVTGPCDGKCDKIPQCKANEKLSPAPCDTLTNKNTICRTEQVCCKEAACVRRGRRCKTRCGYVPHGYQGNGFGNDHCNKCRCHDGAMLCTKIKCKKQYPECLTKGGVCKVIINKKVTVNRADECPFGTKCRGLYKYENPFVAIYTCQKPQFPVARETL